MLHSCKRILGRIKKTLHRHPIYQTFHRYKLVFVLVRVGVKAYQITTSAEAGMEKAKEEQLAEHTSSDWAKQYAFVCRLRLPNKSKSTSPYRVETQTRIYIISCNNQFTVIGYSKNVKS